MFKRINLVLLGLAILLTACGPQGTPTMAPADVNNTAVAAAWTMVAATQLANPTATPLPPTETPSPTPLPTFTPLPLPTLDQTFPTATLASSGNSGADNCLHPLNMAEAGPVNRIRLENASDGAMNLSLNLYTPNAFGQCGALSYTLSKGAKQIISMPRGLWYAYAWVTKKSGSSTASCSFELRIGQGNDLGRLIIGNESCHAQDV